MDCEDSPLVIECGVKGQPRILKPVIKELVRTEVYPPSLELLVDRITIVPNIKDKKGMLEAFRVWLNDGDKCIQGKRLAGIDALYGCLKASDHNVCVWRCSYLTFSLATWITSSSLQT